MRSLAEMKRRDERHVLIDKLTSSQNPPVCNTLLQKLTHDLKVMYHKDRGLRRGKSLADGAKLALDFIKLIERYT